MISTVKVKCFTLPPPDIGEISRYAKGPVAEETVNEISAEVGNVEGKVAYAEFPVSVNGNTVDLGFCTVDSHDLAKTLKDCSSVVVFAATVGFGFDRLVKKYAVTNMAKALYSGAVGTERAEALCDAFCDELREGSGRIGKKLKPRFSPGYGDLPLSLQRDIFAALKVTSLIGVTLNESLFLMPSKSVTAIIGIY